MRATISYTPAAKSSSGVGATGFQLLPHVHQPRGGAGAGAGGADLERAGGTRRAQDEASLAAPARRARPLPGRSRCHAVAVEVADVARRRAVHDLDRFPRDADRDRLCLAHLERLPRDVGRQVAGVHDLDGEREEVAADGSQVGALDRERGEGMGEEVRPRRVRARDVRNLAPRRVLVRELVGPAADLDRAELRMLERLPRQEALAAERLVVPAQEGELLLLRRWGEEALARALDAGGAPDVPQLRHPTIDAKLVVGPIHEGAEAGGGGRLVIPLERGLAREAGVGVGEIAVGAGEVAVAVMGRGGARRQGEDEAAGGVVGDDDPDVGVGEDEIYAGARLRR